MSIETEAAPGAREIAMEGLMQQTPLLVSTIATRAELMFADVEVVSATATGVERSNFGEVTRRARKLASALSKLGIGPGDRVATFGWNSIRHVELYLAVPSLGAVLHTLNIRLFEEDLQYIVEHAEDRVIFLDASLAGAMPHFPGVEHEIVMPDAASERAGALAYEEFLATGDDDFTYPSFDENQAAAMCYTSGTTGRPKGVVYSHRSTVLHTMMINLASEIGLTEADTVMAIVPMFHANAWGLPYAAAMAGSKLVLPGPKMDPRSLADMIDAEHVTFAAGVPTIWQGIAQLDPKPSFASVKNLLSGGAALPEGLARAYDRDWGIAIIQGWGMTETSPLATLNRPRPGDPQQGDEAIKARTLQGRAAPLIEIRLDEEAGGEVQIHGPTIARAYYRDESSAEKFTPDGWLRTGDVAEIMPGRYVHLVDRTKDLVKSGGEWISSVELENEIMGHPDVLEAAVIAVPDERWSERPCACVVKRPGSSLDADALREFLATKVAKWWLPERIEFISEVPKTSVGKFDKKLLRAQAADGSLPAV